MRTPKSIAVLVLLSGALLFGRRGAAQSASPENHRCDTLCIDTSRCAIFVNFTLRDMGLTDSIVDHYGDDHPFFVAMDDAAYYFYKASTYCERNRIPRIIADSTVRFVRFGRENLVDLCDSTRFHLLWDALLYKRTERPTRVSSVDFYQQADVYFGLTTGAEE